MRRELRGRVGLIMPAPGTATEMEFHRIVPAGVQLASTRMPLDISTIERLSNLESYADGCATLLAQARPNLIVFCCTAGSFVRGIGHDREIIKRIEGAVGIPATTTSTAVIEALAAVKAKRVALVTPYLDEVNERERVFLQDNGFQVTALRGLNFSDSYRIAIVEPEEIYGLVRETPIGDAEALFISCTGLMAIDLIEPLEKELGIPVLTSNQATIWAALRKMGIADKIAGCGRLFEEA